MTAVVALDVNETLSDMSALAARLENVGAPGDLVGTWFASTLRDGFALTAAGAYVDFASVAQAVLSSMLAGVGTLDRSVDEASAHVVSGMGELPLHPDVKPGLERLRSGGLRVVTLTNGSADTARRLLDRAGAAQYVEQFLSVEGVGRWKPAPEPYRYAAERCGVRPRDVTLVAVHPWDVDGARRAGLRGAWINRQGASYPQTFAPPDIVASDLAALAAVL
jgi:2-haloacid dehalogenase